MARPQQPELARSARTDIDPDHVETGLQGQPRPGTGGETGPVPPENQPGHHPEQEQDKPDLDAFAARLGTDPTAPGATAARKPPRPERETATPAKTTPAKATPAKTTPAKTTPAKTTPAKAARAASRRTAPPKAAPTPGKLPASAPTPDAVGMSAPQPEPGHDARPEPRLVGLVLLPLRETVKRLEQLDRALTGRLAKQRRWG
jgi:hypothetical protein